VLSSESFVHPYASSRVQTRGFVVVIAGAPTDLLERRQWVGEVVKQREGQGETKNRVKLSRSDRVGSYLAASTSFCICAPNREVDDEGDLPKELSLQDLIAVN
jgi:hypothetical protein